MFLSPTIDGIKRTKLAPVKEEKICPECGEGMMEATGFSKPVSPPLREHKCSSCDHTENYHESYPRITYEIAMPF